MLSSDDAFYCKDELTPGGLQHKAGEWDFTNDIHMQRYYSHQDDEPYKTSVVRQSVIQRSRNAGVNRSGAAGQNISVPS